MSVQFSQGTKSMTDTAYYYPAPYWRSAESGWIKSLLLFFDEVAVLLPDYMYGRHRDADFTLVEPLEERGLLQVLEPKEWVDQEATESLAEIVVGLLRNGAFDDLPESSYYAELSQSRIGYGADVDLADSLVDELQAKNLARPSEDGVSVPLHPAIRTTILVILAQLARVSGPKHGKTIHPATNEARAVADFVQTLSRERMPTYDKVIKLDLEPVTFDLTPVPLDDVLQFRTEHQNAYRAYMRDLQGFMCELANIDDPDEREIVLLERRQEIADTAHDIQRSTRKALGKNLASWFLGIAGGVWSCTSGDPIGLVLTAVSAVPGLVPDGSKNVSAYSYIFDAHRNFGSSLVW